MNRLNTRGALIITALTFALLLGYVAEAVRVAPLVGALARRAYSCPNGTP
ncbi:MAG TPA: hypothetical protein VJV04_03495 [Nitrospiraceae bacterium]|nr:hypothetical protein [Nitrospiraceae bacterium]